jgi:glutamate racemase
MIGIFDSGVGGMTVASAIEHLLPTYPLVYLGDIARTPYGPKSALTIIEYSLENTRFLLAHGAKVIIIACNTAASVATERLRKEFSVPIVEVITPAVGEVIATSTTGRIGIIGTRTTVKSGVYQQKINEQRPEFKVHSTSCPLLVPLIEEGWSEKRETKMILRRYLHPLKHQQLDTLVLGCTHYPLLKHLIGPRMGRKVRLIDSSVATAKFLQQYLLDHPVVDQVPDHLPEKNRYYVTDLTETASTMAARIFHRPVQLLNT